MHDLEKDASLGKVVGDDGHLNKIHEVELNSANHNFLALPASINGPSSFRLNKTNKE